MENKNFNEQKMISVPEAQFLMKKNKNRIFHSKTAEFQKNYKEIYAYAKKFNIFFFQSSTVENFKIESNNFNLTDYETSQIISLMPTTHEELKILIPSIYKNQEGNINKILLVIQKYIH